MVGKAKLQLRKFVTKSERKKENEMTRGRKIHVSNIPPDSDVPLIKSLFLEHGGAEELYIRRDSSNQALYVLVTLNNKKSAELLTEKGTIYLEGWGDLKLCLYMPGGVKDTKDTKGGKEEAAGGCTKAKGNKSEQLKAEKKDQKPPAPKL